MKIKSFILISWVPLQTKVEWNIKWFGKVKFIACLLISYCTLLLSRTFIRRIFRNNKKKKEAKTNNIWMLLKCFK